MKASFDRIAPFYDALAYLAFQGNIQRAQRHFLPMIPENTNLLFIGGGTGFLLPDLFALKRINQITYVEASARMLAKAQKTVTDYREKHPHIKLPSTAFIHGSERDIPSTPHYQVVITNFIFDMYTDEDLPPLMQRIHSCLTPDAIWLFTDFRLSHHRARRIWQRPLLRLMFWFFQRTAGLSNSHLPDYTWHFRNLGWESTQEQSFFGDFIISCVYQSTTALGKNVLLSKRK